MRVLLIIAFVFISASLPAQLLSLDSLQGAWKVERILRTNQRAMVEEYYPPTPDDNIWLFNGDTLRSYYYPYVSLPTKFVRLDSNHLFESDNQRYFASVEKDSGKLHVSMSNFLLVLARTELSGDSLRTIRILDKDLFNPGALLFTYEMVTHFTPDDEEAYDFTPPLKMPRSISFRDSAEIRQVLRTGKLYLKAGREKRPFTFVSIEWERSVYKRGDQYHLIDVPVLTLYSGDWWTGEPFNVVYRAKEKDVAGWQLKQ